MLSSRFTHFFAKFSGLTNSIRQFFRFLDVCNDNDDKDDNGDEDSNNDNNDDVQVEGLGLHSTLYIMWPGLVAASGALFLVAR